MQYSVAEFNQSLDDEAWYGFVQALADIGFEAFDGTKAYIQTALFHPEALKQLVSATDGIETVNIADCPDENWNADWEEEHPLFEWNISDTCTIKIIPHCAFGAGYHETTGMLIEAEKTATIIRHAHVLDNGCGTGILGIVAAKLGADRVSMVDIDDKSVENAIENAQLNGIEVDNVHCTVMQGDTPPADEYDLIMSNIHKNILIQQMPLYARYLRPGGEVWMSGFYENDVKDIVDAAEKAGLKCIEKKESGEWRMIRAECDGQCTMYNIQCTMDNN